MTRRHSADVIERRLEAVRRQLGARHAGIEPDAQFAARVVARLPRGESWSIDWAARRVLPVSIALAVVLGIAVLTTARSSGQAASSTASSSSAENSQRGSDPLEWLLESQKDVQ